MSVIIFMRKSQQYVQDSSESVEDDLFET